MRKENVKMIRMDGEKINKRMVSERQSFNIIYLLITLLRNDYRYNMYKFMCDARAISMTGKWKGICRMPCQICTCIPIS